MQQHDTSREQLCEQVRYWSQRLNVKARVIGIPVATEPRVRLRTPARRVTLIFRRKPTFDARRNIGRRQAESYGPVVHQLIHLSLASNPPSVFG
jgi:hypothetical protein